LGGCTHVERLVIRWPDGSQETISGIKPNQRYRIKQGSGQAAIWQPPKRELQLSPSTIEVPPSTDTSRIVLIAPVPIPEMKYTNRAGQEEPVTSSAGRARLINLWATWCQPCIEELSEWKDHEGELARSGLDIVAINVDQPEPDRESQLKNVDQLLQRISFPFSSGFGSKDLVLQFDVLQRAILRRQRALPVPSSFLIDARGNLRFIYKGPVSATQLAADVKLIDASAEQILAASVPYEGVWLGQPAGSSPYQIAVKFVEGGFTKEAEDYIRQLTTMTIDNPAYNPADAQVLLGAIYLDQKRLDESAEAFRNALKIDPNHRQSHIELAGVLLQLDKPKEAAEHFEHALEKRPNDPELRFKLGMARLAHGDTDEAIKQFSKSIELRPSVLAHHHLGNTFIRLGRIPEAVSQFDAAVSLDERFIPAANNLAWLLATSKHEAVRDGPRAVELAERICSMDTERTPSNLDTLAASYAEAGRFPDAIQTAEEAIRLAKAAGDLKTSQGVRKKMALYRQEIPYRE
jgi:tetratricopeptide (TPR) repeat protein